MVTETPKNLDFQILQLDHNGKFKEFFVESTPKALDYLEAAKNGAPREELVNKASQYVDSVKAEMGKHGAKLPSSHMFEQQLEGLVGRIAKDNNMPIPEGMKGVNGHIFEGEVLSEKSDRMKKSTAEPAPKQTEAEAGKGAKQAAAEVAEDVAKTGLLKKAASAVAKKLPVVAAAFAAKEFVEKAGEANASDLPADLKLKANAYNASRIVVDNLPPGVAELAQQGLKQAITGGDKRIEPFLAQDNVTEINKAAEAARAEAGVKAERAANGTKLSAAMQRAMEQADKEGCRIPANCIEADHSLKPPMQIAAVKSAGVEAKR